MTSRMLMYKTLEMENHNGRAPRDLWHLPWASQHHPDALGAISRDFPNDTAGPPVVLREKPKTSGDQYGIGLYTDEWGCVFENLQTGYIGEVKHPIVPAEDEEWADTSGIHIPVELLTFDETEVNRFCRSTDKFVMSGCLPRPFEQLQFIRGSQNLYMDLALRPAGLFRFIEKMHAFYCEWVEAWCKTEVDAVNMMDDWGSQKSLLISPDMWREIFRPLYKDYIDIAHRYGKKIFMHSDGDTTDIIPELIALGLDAFNTQIFCIGVERLAPFAGKMTFWGEIDRQHLLPYGTEDDIRSAVRLAHDTLWKNGGAIAQCEFGAGAKPENVRAVFDEWDKLTNVSK